MTDGADKAGGGPVAFVLKGYPRLSESFIAEEIAALEQAGLDIRIVALRQPTDRIRHPVHREIRAPVGYLPEYLHHEPRRVLGGLWSAAKTPGFGRALAGFLRDLRRDPSRNRLRRFGQACVLAAELPAGIAGLHAHFIHTPASVARYAARMRGLPWSVSAHAKDIWTSPDWELAEKLDEARFAVTCTAAGQQRLGALTDRPVHLVYHGLDSRRFPPAPEAEAERPARDGSDAADPIRLLTVARAVEKKGLDTLLAALAALPAGLHWRWRHIGGGAGIARLKAEALRLGLDTRIDWSGPAEQRTVLAAYRGAELFVLPCRIAADGDRDGLPNVLIEAQSQGLACLSTHVAAVAELIEPETTGVLVAPDDAAALARAIERLAADPDLRTRLGAAGAARVALRFGRASAIDRLMALFRGAPP